MKNNATPHVLPEIMNAPWAITPDKLNDISAVYQSRLAGDPRDIAPFVAAAQNKGADPEDDPPYEIIEGIAVIPVRGILSRRMNLLTWFSGGTSTELLLRDFRTALADPTVEAILLAVESPGGAVGGITVIADAIYDARGTKPIIAHAGNIMASGAYWIGSAADYIYAEDTSIVGSIGVITMHTDLSRADEMEGIKRTYITAGTYKAIGNDAEPLSDVARKTIEGELNYYYTLFVNAVARNRGVTPDDVLSSMADGRTFAGSQALAAGLVDEIGTIDDAILSAMSRIESQKPHYLIRR